MTQYHVRWTACARDDLEEIIDSIYQTLPEYAIKELDKIEDKANDLDTFPEKYRVVPELREFGYLKYRQLLVDYWRIIYKVEENNVFIMLVIDTRRDLTDILLKELLFRESVE
ncbi:MAG: type II toxin-antitoxin system RelE/ParE family toxin [Spirochaetaceae bacterium]|jgi:plasmid stabilization system protein ParE|nr:type II toxin-antitoxin system RelE/ParE family toxin [Spirochaetaceae bacterium]